MSDVTSATLAYMTPPEGPGNRARHRRRIRRDRHGRGLRGPLAAPPAPLAASPSRSFIREVERQWLQLVAQEPHLRQTRLTVFDAPPAELGWVDYSVTKRRWRQPATLALYRLPIARAAGGQARQRALIQAAIVAGATELD